MIRIFRTGTHAHRMPVAYPALAPLFAGRLEEVTRPEEADLWLFAHPLDLADAPAALADVWRARRPPVVILSEEPFWDTLWGRRPLCRDISIDSRGGRLPAVQLTHATSAIFRFAAIPYYLLSNHRFASAYAARFARNAALTPAEWQVRFATYGADLTFMFERRPGAFHSVHWPEGDILGLCAWRTDLAEACTGPGVRRLGQSWQGGPSRFEIGNWHLDKLVRLDGSTRMLAAIENTHQPEYLTEKLFDAFACGALPLYVASPGHRAHTLGLPPASWLNLHGLSVEQAAGAIAAVRFDAAFFEAYAAAQAALAARFGDTGLWLAERARLAGAVMTALTEVLETHRAPA